jgi:uncharacterized protein
MKKAYFRFYEELNDFLNEEKQKKRFEYYFSGSPSVKDAAEAIGVPHTEIDLILVNGISVDFGYNIKNDDEISVYPVFESFDISPVQHLRPAPLRNIGFIADVQLGSLAKYMRMAGLDTLYSNNTNEEELIRIATEEKRSILTRNRNLVKRKEVTHAYWIRSDETGEQLKEVIRRYHLENYLNAFSRCMECNSLLAAVSKSEVEDELPPMIRKNQTEFRKCPKCAKIYWKGSHYDRMHSFIAKLKDTL